MRRGGQIALWIWAVLVVLFLMFPIVLIILYAFNPSNVQSWPLPGLSTKWFSQTFQNDAMRQSLWLSVRAGLIASAIAIVLGSMAAFAVHRFRFFGREVVSFVLILPLALPGNHHRDGAQLVLHLRRRQPVAADDRHRTRDVLHRDRLQQRHRPAAPHADVADRGLDGPRRRRADDVSPRDPAGDRHGARRRAACSRSPCRSTK